MADPYDVEQAMPGVEWRRVNQDYVEKTGSIPPYSERLQILHLSPWTRAQRLLHRLHICRWHRHVSHSIFPRMQILGGDVVIDQYLRVDRDD